MIPFADLVPGPDGLVVTIVRHAIDGDILMVGYSNRASLEATAETGLLHFWSRSRDELWLKGETSGSTLSVESMRMDCDRDALLVDVAPAGPVCHTGAAGCFDDVPSGSLGSVVDRLVHIIAQRRAGRPDGSYTVELLDDVDLVARKVLEEAGEVAFAAKDLALGADPGDVASEAADLLYHLLALLESVDVSAEDVGHALTDRMA